jgi:DNA-binding LacI/PurR family transcriptional regulator
MRAIDGIPSPHQRRLIAGKAIMPERTVLRTYLDPTAVRDATLTRVIEAAAQLGITPPTTAQKAA